MKKQKNKITYIRIPTATSDAPPHWEERLGGDTSQSQTAQRHKLSGDVMQLSSLVQRQCEGGREGGEREEEEESKNGKEGEVGVEERR